jgi:hypothetical protein
LIWIEPITGAACEPCPWHKDNRMDFKLFKTRGEAEAFVVQKQEQQKQSGHIVKTYGVEERYLVKSQIAFPDAPIEYLMEDNSFIID